MGPWPLVFRDSIIMYRFNHGNDFKDQIQIQITNVMILYIDEVMEICLTYWYTVPKYPATLHYLAASYG